jgi:hypothetical protein
MVAGLDEVACSLCLHRHRRLVVEQLLDEHLQV